MAHEQNKTRSFAFITLLILCTSLVCQSCGLRWEVPSAKLNCVVHPPPLRTLQQRRLQQSLPKVGEERRVKVNTHRQAPAVPVAQLVEQGANNTMMVALVPREHA